MKIKWLVDSVLMTEDELNWLRTNLDESIDVHIAKYRPFIDKIDEGGFSYNDPVVVYGSIQFARGTRNFIGNLWDEQQYLVTNYRETAFDFTDDSYWLNNGLFTTWGFLLRNYKNIIPESDCLFIRPNSGGKVFTGFPIHKNNLTEEASKQMQLTGVDNSTLVQVNPANNQIHSEYRCIFYKGKFITGSMYNRGGNKEESSVIPSQVIDFSKEIAPHSCWDFPFVCDIALLNDNSCKIIELNCITCSGWYHSEYTKIVECLNDWTYKAWKEINGY